MTDEQSARENEATHRPASKSAPPQQVSALVALILLMLLTIPAAAITIAELGPADRPGAWRTFAIATLTGLALAMGTVAWQWRDASRRGWAPASQIDPKKLRYFVGACGGVGLLLSDLVAGTRGVVIYGFGAGFFPIFFIGLYVIERRRRSVAS